MVRMLKVFVTSEQKNNDTKSLAELDKYSGEWVLNLAAAYVKDPSDPVRSC